MYHFPKPTKVGVSLMQEGAEVAGPSEWEIHQALAGPLATPICMYLGLIGWFIGCAGFFLRNLGKRMILYKSYLNDFLEELFLGMFFIILFSSVKMLVGGWRVDICYYGY